MTWEAPNPPPAKRNLHCCCQCAAPTTADVLKVTRHPSHIHKNIARARLSLFDFVLMRCKMLQASFHYPVVGEPSLMGQQGFSVMMHSVVPSESGGFVVCNPAPAPQNVHDFCQCTGPATADLLKVTHRISTANKYNQLSHALA